MVDSFNAYREWLGIDAAPSPRNFYQLLSLPDTESDRDKIASAADRALTKVRGFKPGANARNWAALLDEIKEAKRRLLDASEKQAYDEQVRNGSVAPVSGALSSPSAGPAAPAAPSNPAMYPPGMGQASSGAPVIPTAPSTWPQTPSTPGHGSPQGGFSPDPYGGITPGAAPQPYGSPSQSASPQMPYSGSPASNPPAGVDPMAPVGGFPQSSTPSAGFNSPASYEPYDYDPMAPADPYGAPGAGSPPANPMAAYPAPSNPMAATPQAGNPPAYNPQAYAQPGNAQGGIPVSPYNPMAPASGAGAATPYAAPMAGYSTPIASNGYGAPTTPLVTPYADEDLGAGTPTVKHGKQSLAQQRKSQGRQTGLLAVGSLVIFGLLAGAIYLFVNKTAGTDAVAVVPGQEQTPPPVTGNDLPGAIMPPVNPANPGQTNPAPVNPTANVPPMVNPPASNPPASNPPAGNPSTGNPPMGNPPMGKEPLFKKDPSFEPDPPSSNPPATDPAPSQSPAEDPAMADPFGVNPAMANLPGGAADPETMASVGTPGTAPTEPPPAGPPKPTANDVRQLSESLTKARAALHARDFGTVAKELTVIDKLPQLPVHQEKSDRLESLVGLSRQFWEAVTSELARLKGGDELQIGDTFVSIVEAEPDHLTIRTAGRNQRYATRDIPAGLARVLAERFLNQQDPQNVAVIGAIYAVESNTDDPAKRREYAGKARQYWKQAESGGAKLGDLVKVLDDTYDRLADDLK
ncbi:hypothetical protein [Lignipirellula cremea]|uniref:Uncharacterized protein n=1 Tax=Lignipirellula cremea TaxID=2528010 RepID=A0A518DQV9_9BACT|nr:hypothetical protein [Lignipirellula cremea]QDU94225.1 hypothetical protein Pla8534_20130 [Lignipirellula cremea]